MKCRNPNYDSEKIINDALAVNLGGIMMAKLEESYFPFLIFHFSFAIVGQGVKFRVEALACVAKPQPEGSHPTRAARAGNPG
jgi:hypothetical protein